MTPNGIQRLILTFSLLFFIPLCPLPDPEWCEKSEETCAPKLLENDSSAQEPPNPLEPFGPRDCLVPVVFPGPVSQEGCCRFTCELLKHILYQRQQFPLPYEQLKLFYRKPSPQVGAGLEGKLVGDHVAEKPRQEGEIVYEVEVHEGLER